MRRGPERGRNVRREAGWDCKGGRNGNETAAKLEAVRRFKKSLEAGETRQRRRRQMIYEIAFAVANFAAVMNQRGEG